MKIDKRASLILAYVFAGLTCCCFLLPFLLSADSEDKAPVLVVLILGADFWLASGVFAYRFQKAQTTRE